MLSKFKNIRKWMEDNPKTFYKYTMGILVPMFIISTIYSFMNPPTLQIGDTPLPSGKAVEVPMHYNKNIELEPIIMEISELKDIDFSMVEQIPNITVKSPQSFVIIAAKYSASKDLEVVYFADSETSTVNQTISLADIAEFDEITDWTNMHIFVWNSLAEMRPLGDPYICAQ